MNRHLGVGVLTVLVATLACCGDDLPAPGREPEPRFDLNDELRSGTRLKLQWHEVGGVRGYEAVFDSQLEVTCSAGELAAGEWRCLPPSEPAVYADANCTQRVARTISGGTRPPRYVRAVEEEGCGDAKIYEVGSGPSVGAQFYQRTSSGCSGPSFSATFPLSREVPSSELVALTRVMDEAERGRLRHRFYAASDGAVIPAGLYDTELETECELVRGELPGTVKCAPVGMVQSLGGGLYLDASCARRAVLASPSCVAPRFAYELESSCLGTTTAVFALAPARPQSSYFTWTSTTSCIESPLDGPTLHELGAEVPLPSFAVQPAEGEGEVRLQRMRIKGQRVSLPWFFDRDLQAECSLVKGGALEPRRCFPKDPYGASRSISRTSRCESLESMMLYPRSCDPGSLPAFATTRWEGDGERRRVGALVTVPVHTYVARFVCGPVAEDLVAYEVGPTIPLQSFAAATVVTDP